MKGLNWGLSEQWTSAVVPAYKHTQINMFDISQAYNTHDTIHTDTTHTKRPQFLPFSSALFSSSSVSIDQSRQRAKRWQFTTHHIQTLTLLHLFAALKYTRQLRIYPIPFDSRACAGIWTLKSYPLRINAHPFTHIIRVVCIQHV